MDKNNKEKWVNDTIESIKGIRQAEASPFLYTRVLSKIKSGAGLKGYIPVKKAALGLLSVLILAALNLAVLTGINRGNKDETESKGGYELIPSQTNPYLELLSE